MLVEGAGLGLVPHRAGAGVVWTRVCRADRRPLADLGEADRRLRTALSESATALAALDVARWRPEVADELMNLRHRTGVRRSRRARRPAASTSPAGRSRRWASSSSPSRTTAARSARARPMRREDALRPLDAAARRALVAACSPEVWPPGLIGTTSLRRAGPDARGRCRPGRRR